MEAYVVMLETLIYIWRAAVECVLRLNGVTRYYQVYGYTGFAKYLIEKIFATPICVLKTTPSMAAAPNIDNAATRWKPRPIRMPSFSWTWRDFFLEDMALQS